MMKRKNDIKKKYSSKIKVRKDGKQFYIYINRKQITAITYDGLIDKLYDMEYGRSQSSLEGLYSEYLIWRRDFTNISSKSLKEFTFTWNRFMKGEELRLIPVIELKTKDFICLFRRWTKDCTLSKKQFGSIKSLLNGIMQYALEQEIVESNPIRDVNCRQFSFKPVNNESDVFSFEERKILLEYLKNNNEMYSLAIQFDFHMVLRIAELLALKWDDIRGDNIYVQKQRIVYYAMNDDLSFKPREFKEAERIKGNSDDGFRYQPLTPTAKIILEKAKLQNPDGEYIFMKDGRQLLGDSFNRYLGKYCIQAGVEKRSSHKIRFTVASILYSKGMPLTALQKLLGHTTTSMTLHYLRQVLPVEETTNIMCSALE